MKIVIYKILGVYHTTTEENYRSRVVNARKVHKMDGFESADEIIEYYCRNFGSKKEDFIIIEE